MKKLLMVAAFAAVSAATAATLEEMLQAKYERDMQTESGRAWWHGKKKSHVVDQTNMVSIVTYEDGTVFRDKAKVVTPNDAAKTANAKLKRTVDSRGVPAALAEARKRREEEKQTVSNVTVTVTAGGK